MHLPRILQVFPAREQKFLTSKQEVRGYIKVVLWLISVRVFFSTSVIKADVKGALMDGLYLKALERVAVGKSPVFLVSCFLPFLHWPSSLGYKPCQKEGGNRWVRNWLYLRSHYLCPWSNVGNTATYLPSTPLWCFGFRCNVKLCVHTRMF